MRKYVWDIVHTYSGESVLKDLVLDYREAVRILNTFGIDRNDYTIVPIRKD